MIPGLVSVVVPVFNGDRFLEETLRSICQQTYRPMELIIIDDGSTDGTAAIARSFTDATYIYQSNQGVSAARNAGVRASQGEFLAFGDADDIWAADKLETQVEHLNRFREDDGTVTHLQNFVERGAEIPHWVSHDMLSKPTPGYAPLTLLVRRSSFDRIGGWNESLRVGEGAEWFTRAKDGGVRLTILAAVLLRRRLHQANLHYQGTEMRRNLVRTLKSSIDRQRAILARKSQEQ